MLTLLLFVGVVCCGTMLPNNLVVVPNTGSLLDKYIVGYTGIGNSPDDGTNLGYRGWAKNNNWMDNLGFPMYPYVDSSIYPNAQLKATPTSWNMPKLGNGKPAQIYTGMDYWVTDAHIKMLAVSGIHTVTLERFLSEVWSGCDPRTSKNKNQVLDNAAKAAQKYGRLFLVEYDLSGASDPPLSNVWVDELKKDFTNVVSKYVTNPNYARHYGKPAVLLWKGPHDIGVDKFQSAVDYFKSLNMSVIIGLNWDWLEHDQKYLPVVKSAGAVSGWCMGSSVHDIETNVRTQANTDAQWCSENHVNYLFLLCSGPSYNRVSDQEVVNVTNGLNNDYHYQHVVILSEIRKTFVNKIEIGGWHAMFDDYAEAEVLAPLAPTVADLPGGKPYWQYLDKETGDHRSADFNLRMTSSNIQMLHNTQVFPAQTPIKLDDYTLLDLLNKWPK